MDNITFNQSVVPSATTSSTTSSEQGSQVSHSMASGTANTVSRERPIEFSQDEEITEASLTERTVTQPVATTTTQSSEGLKEKTEFQKALIKFKALLFGLPLEMQGQIYEKLELQDLLNLRDSEIFNSEDYAHELSEVNRLIRKAVESEVNAMIAARDGDVNGVNDFGQTLLHECAQSGKFEHVRILMDKGADVNARDNNNVTVLHAATEGGNVQICRLFIENGADINAQDNYGKAALHIVARRRYDSSVIELCKLFIEKGARIDVEDDQGKNILIYAAEGGDVEVCRLFIKAGADMNNQDRYGETVLNAAVKMNDLAMLKFWISQGLDMAVKNHDGDTLLHQAVTFSDNSECEMVRFLVNQRLDIHAQNDAGETPLSIADDWRKTEVITILQEAQGRS